MPKLSTLKLTPLPIVITLAIGDEVNGLDVDTPSPEVDGRTYDGMDGSVLVWLNAGCLTSAWPVAASVIAHEVAHVVDAAFEYVGETSHASELRAYYVGHITEWIAQQVAKRA